MSNYEEICEKIIALVQRLTFDEQLQLLEALVRFIRHQHQAKPKHSIMEFEGLGKEVWEGVDVEKYIDEERNSWER